MVELLDPISQPKFINLLPSPPRIDATDGGKFHIDMRQTDQWLGLYSGPGADGIYGTADDEKLDTTIWGYGLSGQPSTYPGPTFIAQSGVPIQVKWSNHLPEGEHLLPVDESILTPAQIQALKDGYIPTVVHLHGGNTEADSDGYPEAWFTQNYAETGAAWVKKIYTYDNDQEAATLWYHDHTLGLTHLNIYAGLAGMYLLRDDNENRLIDYNILPSGPYEQELLLQDRMFTADGQLYIPTDTETAGAPNNSLTPEFFGNFMMVNGMAWPKLDVEPRKYRFELVNGTDSRTYILKFDNPAEKFYEIGTAQGFLDKPIALDQIVLAPGQRMDIVVDFSDNPIGDELILQNFGPDSPFGGLNADDLQPADPATTGQVMKFVVDKPLSDVPNAKIDLQGLTTSLRTTPLTTPVQTGPIESVVLFESEDAFGRIQPRFGTLADGSLLWTDPATENIPLGTSAVWEIYNTTEDSHSVHLHSSAFQILSRQSFEGDVIEAGTDSAGGIKQYLQNVRLTGTPQGPDPSEQGWEDTLNINPGEVIRLITRPYTQPGTFVWHCHVLSHEDNAMMRPFNVVATSDNDMSSSYLSTGMASGMGTNANNWLNTNQLPSSDGRLLTTATTGLDAQLKTSIG